VVAAVKSCWLVETLKAKANSLCSTNERCFEKTASRTPLKTLVQHEETQEMLTKILTYHVLLEV